MIRGGAVPGIAGLDKVFVFEDSKVRKQIERLKSNQKKLHYRMHVYERREGVYKITLVFTGRRFKEMQERERQARAVGNMETFYQGLKAELGIEWESNMQYEEGCLQILAPGVCKLSGVKYICQQAGFSREDVMTYGDGETDTQMMEYYNSIK